MHQFKEQIREKARKALISNGIDFESFNDDIHWKIGKINFYPTTGKWFDVASGNEDVGYKSLIKYLNPKKSNVRTLSVEQLFDIAKTSKDKSLFGICESIHKEIYKKEV